MVAERLRMRSSKERIQIDVTIGDVTIVVMLLKTLLARHPHWKGAREIVDRFFEAISKAIDDSERRMH